MGSESLKVVSSKVIFVRERMFFVSHIVVKYMNIWGIDGKFHFCLVNQPKTSQSRPLKEKSVKLPESLYENLSRTTNASLTLVSINL